MLSAARRRPTRWIAALALTAAAAAVPTAAMSATSATAATTAPSDACGAAVLKQDGTRYACTFVDNFSGSALDTTKWITQDSTYSGFTISGECYDKNRNVAVSGGLLRLSVTKAAKPFTCTTPYGSYQTQYMGSTVSTQTKFAQAYGRFEARIKFPTGKAGIHGGFWMNPRDSKYGEWPKSGEIDVAESYSSVNNYVFPSLHYAGETGADTGWWTCNVGDITQWHTYAVEWDRSVMRFVYDGKVCFTRSWSGTLGTEAPFDQPFFQVLSAAVGGGANAPAPDLKFPQAVQVDYVKAWK